MKTAPGTAPVAIKPEIEAVCAQVRKRESNILDTRVDLYLSTDGYEMRRGVGIENMGNCTKVYAMAVRGYLQST